MGHRYLLFTSLALVALGAAGCGPDIRAVCEAQEACVGGNELDVDACVATFEGSEDLAHDIGCGAEYDAYVTCVEPLLECNSQATGQPCAMDSECGGAGVCEASVCTVKLYGFDPSNNDQCEAEQNAYSRCN
jgi:hypothetical protein